MRYWLAFALLGLAACDSASDLPGAPSAQRASPAAPIEIVDLAGLEGVLEKHRGRAVVLNFWAMW